jgi:hypothetical protein
MKIKKYKDFNLLPKEYKKSVAIDYLEKAVVLLIFITMISVVLLNNLKVEKEGELRNYNKILEGKMQQSKKLKDDLDKNEVFNNLRIKGSYKIKPRVAFEGARYDDLLKIIYGLTPGNSLIKDLKFITAEGRFIVSGQCTDYIDLTTLVAAYEDAKLSESTTFEKMTYDKENSVINFDLSCVLDKSLNDKVVKKETPKKESTQKSTEEKTTDNKNTEEKAKNESKESTAKEGSE